TVVSGGTEVKLTINGNEQTIDTGDGTLQGLVHALNASGTGVKASTVKLNDGSYGLVVQSENTGESARFTLTNLDGSDLLGGASVSQAENARVVVDGHSVTSETNTFEDIIGGVTFTVTGEALGKTVDVNVAADVD